MTTPTLSGWALVLGASSGFGEATALHLARAGMNVFGVHLDRRATLPNAERIKHEIEELGRKALFFNINAADPVQRAEVADQMAATVTTDAANSTLHGAAKAPVGVVMHSLAFGALRPFIGSSEQEPLTREQMDMTLDVMAHSLVYWVQELFKRRLIGQGTRIYAMTSAGSHRVVPSYGAVSAAKAALESHIRQLALELAPYGVTANAIRAGATDTPALRKIPGNDQILETARSKNPHGRLTTPNDVASAVVALSRAGTEWMSGNVIGVDGGEDISGF